MTVADFEQGLKPRELTEEERNSTPFKRAEAWQEEFEELAHLLDHIVRQEIDLDQIVPALDRIHAALNAAQDMAVLACDIAMAETVTFNADYLAHMHTPSRLPNVA